MANEFPKNKKQRHSIRARIAIVFFVAFAVFFSALLIDFSLYLRVVTKGDGDTTSNADGIVVLTGGRERIQHALTMLVAGQGKRLLISGVHPATEVGQLAKLTAHRPELFSCCVDLDRDALDTVGNAVSSARWAKEHDYKSLIVVTSAYHMPRALIEFKRKLPYMELVPSPVYHHRLELSQWFRSSEIAGVLLNEYGKYVLARLRMSLDGAIGPLG
ncbi:YdcF family protein [Polycladidibacter hongkongensis]|uniref:YdcF family protein n=1 Tax=Polycladidibacter hongkongensis TaxID=1647556 RepID=UPI0008363586|nr:YdcF family protein [Pseudovibrio hongkongensis]